MSRVEAAVIRLQRILTIVVLVVPPTGARAQARPPADSQRIGGSMRVLQLLQGFQMATSPELASAINALLMDDGAHMRMASRREVAPGDSARAGEIVTTARAALNKYADVKLAEQDGYVKFLPWLDDQAIYHYNNIGNALATLGGFDATRPVSLLYKKDDHGALKLVGAMYNAPPNATPADLDSRLPTSIAHWHEHVDFCAANPDSVRAGVVKPDAATAAKWLKITTREECAAVGGRFVPRLFGWMAHVYLFAGDDPKTIWGGDDHGSMDVHMHPPGGD
jgi:hypothetical protein